MMEGQLKNRDGKLYVVYSTTEYGRPTRVNLWWRVVQIVGNQYNANRPSAGDTATSRGGGQWSTHGSSGPSGGVSTGTGSTQAEFREEVEVPPPASRGKELRWQDGRWEKLMASGWVPAGEGKAKASALRHATKKSPVQLQREIDEVLAKPKQSHSSSVAEFDPDPAGKNLTTAQRRALGNIIALGGAQDTGMGGDRPGAVRKSVVNALYEMGLVTPDPTGPRFSDRTLIIGSATVWQPTAAGIRAFGPEVARVT
jgi:hypothetical protein